jgi:PcfJ-like protein
VDSKPKSNKIKRTEAKRRLELRAERRGRVDPKVAFAIKLAQADRALKESKAVRTDPEGLLQSILRGEPVRVPLNSDLHVIARLFERANPDQAVTYPLRPDLAAFRGLVLLCREKTDLLRGQGSPQFARALLALSAHAGRWVRGPEGWEPRSHNAYRQFHALVRHLTARYDVPTFLNTAWLEGLTPTGVVHQRWFLHVAQGQNIRTADGLTVPLSKRQAHLYLQAPDDFDVLGAFRWAQVLDLGGDERLVRSVLSTRIATDFKHDEFWVTVLRWLVAHPMLDGVHHGPMIDYLHERRFVGSVPNPDAAIPGQPLLAPQQPNLTMKGRDPETLLRSVAEWHRSLGRQKSGKVVYWEPSGITAFRHEEGKDDSRKVYTITELLCSRDLNAEGRAMSHCVGTYADSCASGRVSIWSLKLSDALGQVTRLLTLEVSNQNRQVVQARQRYNKLPSPKELSILHRWAGSGGPSPSKWLSR